MVKYAEGTSDVTKGQKNVEQGGTRRDWGGRVRSQNKRSPMLEEITTFEVEANTLQATGLELIQRALNSLAGRQAESSEQNVEIADRIRSLANQFGAKLLHNGRHIYLRWKGGVFLVASPDSSRQQIHSSSGFPHLTVEAKQAIVNDDDSSKGSGPHSGRVSKNNSINKSRLPG